MKKVVLALLVVFGLAVAGVAIFLATFDADRYRPQLVDALQDALDRPVELARVELAWQGGVAIRLKSLTVFDDSAKQHALLDVDSISALVRLLPLFQRHVEVSSIVFRKPHAHLARDAGGQINLLGLAPLAPVASPMAAEPITSIGGTPVSFQIDTLRIEDGTLHWRDLAVSPPMELDVTAVEITVTNIASTKPGIPPRAGSATGVPQGESARPTGPMDIHVSGALASEVSNLDVSGRLTVSAGGALGAFDGVRATLREVPLEQLLSMTHATGPQVQGIASVSLEGRVASFEPSEIANAISAQGRLQLDQARLANLNVLRVVFERLSMLPGLVQRLESRLPPAYQEKLAAKDTLLQPIDLPFQLERGVLRFDRFNVSTDTFDLTGAGTVGLDRTVRISSRLRIDAVLSDAVIRSVAELRALTNASGEIELPVSVQGTAPHMAVLPDVNYVASKVITTKAADVIGELLRKRAPEAPEDASPSPTGNLLGELLQRALERNE